MYLTNKGNLCVFRWSALNSRYPDPLLGSPTYLLQRRFHMIVNAQWEGYLRTPAKNSDETRSVQTNELELQHFVRGAIQGNCLNCPVKADFIQFSGRAIAAARF